MLPLETFGIPQELLPTLQCTRAHGLFMVQDICGTAWPAFDYNLQKEVFSHVVMGRNMSSYLERRSSGTKSNFPP